MGRVATVTDLLDQVTDLAERPEPPSRHGSDEWGSEFDRFLARLVPGELPRDEFDRALLFAALGSALTLAAAFVLMLLPSEESIRGGGFYAIGRDSLADAMAFAGGAAIPLAGLAISLLALTGIAGLTRHLEAATPALCVVQPIIGVATLAGSGFAWVGLLAIVVLNLVLWAALITAAVMIGLGFLGALIGGAING